jgi:hypothetical protein
MPRAGAGGGSVTGWGASGRKLRRRPLALLALSWGNNRQSTVPVRGSTRCTWPRSQAAKRTSNVGRCRYWFGTSVTVRPATPSIVGQRAARLRQPHADQAWHGRWQDSKAGVHGPV